MRLPSIKVFHDKKKLLSPTLKITIITLVLVTFLILYKFPISLPKNVVNFLEQNNIYLRSDRWVIRFFFPFYISSESLSLKLKNNVNLEIKNIKLKLNLLNFIFQKNPQINKIQIPKINLYISFNSKKKTDIKETNNIHSYIQTFVEKLNYLFNISPSIEIMKLNLFFKAQDSNTPFLTAENILLKNQDRKSYQVTSNLYIGGWLSSKLKAHFFIDPETQNSTFQYNKINTYISSTINFSKLMNLFPRSKFDLKGNAKINQTLSFHSSSKKVIYSHLIRMSEFQLKSLKIDKTLIEITESDNIQILASGEISLHRLLLPSFILQIGKNQLKATFEWVYNNPFAKFKFSQNSFISWNALEGLLGTFINKEIHKKLSSSIGYIKLFSLYLYPWKKQIHYSGYLYLGYPYHIGVQKKWPIFTGKFGGYNNFVYSKIIVAKAKNNKVDLVNLRIFFSKSIFFTLMTKGSINLSDFYKDTSGKIFWKGTLKCKVLKKLQCAREPLEIKTENLDLPAEWRLKLHELASINLGPLKSFNPNGKIHVKEIITTGFTQDNRIFLDETRLFTDIGNFNVNGYWAPLQNRGEFKIGFLPLEIDKIIRTLPLVGEVLNVAVEYFLEFTFKLLIQESQVKVANFVVSKALGKKLSPK